MSYLIDYDTLTVEAVHEDASVMQDFIEAEGLALALTVISSEDDLLLNMSIEEMSGLCENTDRTRKFEDEEDAAAFTMAILNRKKGDFPAFSAKASKRANEKATSESKKAPASRKLKTATTSTGTKQTSKSIAGKVLTLGISAPTKGLHKVLYDFVEENLGEVSVEDLTEHFMFETDADEKKAIGYILGSIRRDYLGVKNA